MAPKRNKFNIDEDVYDLIDSMSEEKSTPTRDRPGLVLYSERRELHVHAMQLSMSFLMSCFTG